MKSGGIDLFEEQASINDNVNHPAHYNTGKYESIDVMVETQGAAAVKDFCICNAFKYIYRHRFKNGLEDIKKAIWYLNKFVELEESEYKKWDTPPKVELPTEITTCISVLTSALETEPQTEGEDE